LVYTNIRNCKKGIEITEENIHLKVTRDYLYKIIDEYENKPMKELPKEQIEFIKRYLNDFFENPNSVNMNEFKFLLQTAF
jgi:hypothetical protein